MHASSMFLIADTSHKGGFERDMQPNMIALATIVRLSRASLGREADQRSSLLSQQQC